MAPCLPFDDPQRTVLHNELHARPSVQVSLPALVTYVAVLNAGVARQEECLHLRKLPGQATLSLDQLQGNFLQLRVSDWILKWERHTEFTRYSIVKSLPSAAPLAGFDTELLQPTADVALWLSGIPGQTIAAIQLVMTHGDLGDPAMLMERSREWFGHRELVASQMGTSALRTRGHSWALTEFKIGDDGFERFLVIAPEDTTPTRAGRISQRLLELETYRLMALRGLPDAKLLGPMLSEAENALASITAGLESKSASDQELLDTLVAVAARVERATAEHSYRFAATNAYNSLVLQRITELREKPIPGTQTLGEFLQRRLSPAMATVAATSHRLTSLSERISRASALLRTRVDIATEAQNQQLLEKLTRGQELQLRLQSTVEGLSIAAITYYVISLLLYVGKALKATGYALNPEILAGASVPLVLWGVWRMTRHIHATLHKAHG